jgi:hypothetical protein
MNALSFGGAFAEGTRMKRERAIDDMSKLQDVENKKRQGAALDYELQKAQEQEKMDSAFYPVSSALKDPASNENLLKLWENKAMEGGFKDHIKKVGEDMYVTGKAMKYIKSLYGGAKEQGEMAEATLKASMADVQSNVIKLNKLKIEGKDGKKLKPEEEQEIDGKLDGYKQMAAQLLGFEKQLKEEKKAKAKQIGVTGTGSPLGAGKWINQDEQGNTTVEGKPYQPNAKYGDKVQAEINAAVGRSSNSTVFHVPGKYEGETEEEKLKRGWDTLPPQTKARFHNDMLEYYEFKKGAGKTKDGKGGVSLF